MDTHARTGDVDLTQDLVARGHRYDFFEAMRILEALTSGAVAPGESGPLEREALRFRSHPSLGFPATDVAGIANPPAHPERFELTLTFLGLCGVSSPLPGYFLSPMVKGQEGGEALREFLAMFEHRFYSLYWRAWKKYRLELDAWDETGRAVRLLLYLAGLSPPSGQASSGPWKWLEPRRVAVFAGLLSTPHRSAAGLRGLVGGYFGGLPVEVMEGVPRRVFVRNRPRVTHQPGANGGAPPARLGQSALVGDFVRDRSGTVRLRIGPVGLDVYVALIPGGVWSRTLGELMRLYLPPGVDFQVQLELVHPEVPGCRLGHSLTRLGRLSWLGHPAGNGLSDAISAAAFAA